MDLFFSYASQGGLTDLTGLLEEYGPNLASFIGEDGLRYGRVGSEQLMVPAKRAYQGIFADWIRRDWLDAVGLPMPTTTEEWYNAIRTIKEEDPGNVGSENVVGYWLDANGVRLGALYTQNLVYSFVTELTDEQRYTLPDVAKPGYKEGVRFLNQLYHEGLINQDFALATTVDPFREAIANNRVASVTDTYWQLFGGDAVMALVESEPSAFYEAGLMFQNAAGEYPREIYAPIDMLLMVPTFSENAEAAVKYLDWLSLAENHDYIWFGEEGVNHEVVDGIKVSLPLDVQLERAPEGRLLNNGDMGIVRRNAFYDTSTPSGLDMFTQSNLIGLRRQGRDSEADMRASGISVATVDGFTPPFFGQPLEAEGRYGSVLADKHLEIVIRSIMANPSNFDTVYDDLLDEYMAAGGRAVIEQKTQVYRESIR
jgi:putative aldouronate transport system substrate-binding protein